MYYIALLTPGCFIFRMDRLCPQCVAGFKLWIFNIVQQHTEWQCCSVCCCFLFSVLWKCSGWISVDWMKAQFKQWCDCVPQPDGVGFRSPISEFGAEEKSKSTDCDPVHRLLRDNLSIKINDTDDRPSRFASSSKIQLSLKRMTKFPSATALPQS